MNWKPICQMNTLLVQVLTLLIALLEPIDTLRQMEQAGDFTARLALLEDMKLMPFGAVWHYHCLQQGVPPDLNWMQEVCRYEEDILAKRI